MWRWWRGEWWSWDDDNGWVREEEDRSWAAPAVGSSSSTGSAWSICSGPAAGPAPAAGAAPAVGAAPGAAAAAAVAAGAGGPPAAPAAASGATGPGTAVAVRQVFVREFFRGFQEFTGNYKQHNAALKWFRRVQADEPNDLHFSNTEKAAVAAIIKDKGMDYDFDETRRVVWSWFEMVAQLDDESMAYVVNGPDNRSGGLTGCWFSARPGSYDHKGHHQLKHEGKPKRDARLRVWDFLLVRADGSSVRLHPQWSTTTVESFPGEGHTTEVEPPARGLGESDGPGTSAGTQRNLKFDALKRPA